MGQITVLLVNWAGPFGGAEKYQLDFVKAMDGLRYRFVFASPAGEWPRRLAEAGYKHYEAAMRPGLDLASVARLHAIIRSESVHIVHAQQSRALLQAGLAARLAGNVAVVQTEYNITLAWHKRGEYPWYVRWINNPVRRLMTRSLADRIISIGESGRAFYIDVLKLPPDKVVVIHPPMAVSQERTRPANAHPIIGTAAELTERKGLIELVHAAEVVIARHPDAQFLIMGRGHLESRLRQLITEKGLQQNVHLLGFVPNASDCMPEWDVFVLPSLSDLFPRAILEAMSHGLPVVSTTVDGALEMVVDGKTGLLVPPGDAQALAQALSRLLDNLELARSMGQKGRERVAQVFSPQQCAAQLDALFQDVMRARPARSRS